MKLRLTYLLFILLCSISLLAESKPIPRANWWVTQVDGTDYVDDVGKYTSIAMDSNDYPHISYYDNLNQDLKYAKWDGTSWQIQVLETDGDVGYHTGIALDSKGFPHICYGKKLNYDDKDLKYAYWDGTKWNIQVVDSEGNVGGRCNIAIDKSDRPHIAYCARTGTTNDRKLRYARWDGSQWIFQDVVTSPNSSQAAAMVLDSQDYAHFVYYDPVNSRVGYVHWNGTAWASEIVDSGTQFYNTDIDVDSQKRPHICYTAQNGTQMKYAHWNGSSWVLQVIEQGANDEAEFLENVSIAVGPDDRPHVSYWEFMHKDLHYATFDGTQWQVKNVDYWGKVGSFNCITVDSKGYPHITYYYKTEEPNRAQYGALKYAYLSDEPVIQKGWKYQAVDYQGMDVYCGKFGSMVLDSNDYAHIVYMEERDESIPSRDVTTMKYARRTSRGTWQIITLDNQTGIWGQSSIAMDSSRKLHVSYGVQNGEIGGLVYATGSYTTWTVTNIDTLRCGSTSIAIDGNSRPHIAYCDEDNRCIKYAHWTGTEWFIDVVDGGEGVNMGGAVALAVDGLNIPHISYFDQTNQDLKYAVWSAEQKAWQTTTIDSEGAVGKFTAIKVDAQNFPHISYSGPDNSTQCDLKYAYWDGKSWQIQVVDDTALMYGTTDLILDKDGHPHITYYNHTRRDLKYANWTAKGWQIGNVDTAGHVGKYSALALDRNGFPHVSYVYMTDMHITSTLKYAYYSDKWNFITLKSFEAQKADPGIAVKWETGTEIDNAGFYIWRSMSEDGEYVRLHDAIIPSEGEGNMGAKYTYNDVTAQIGNTYYYKLEDMDYQGKTTMHGPIEITVKDE